MGTPDRWIRLVVVAPVLLVLGYVLGPTAWYSWLFYVVAAVMAVTAVVGFCPLYRVLGVRTNRSVGTDQRVGV